MLQEELVISDLEVIMELKQSKMLQRSLHDTIHFGGIQKMIVESQVRLVLLRKKRTS